MKVVINKCYGGFGLSPQAEALYAKKAGFELYFYEQLGFHHDGSCKYVRRNYNDCENAFIYFTYKKDLGEELTDLPEGEDSQYWHSGNVERNDPLLVEVVEELGNNASGTFAKLKIVDIPDDIKWYIDEYDGIESIHQEHQSWG